MTASGLGPIEVSSDAVVEYPRGLLDFAPSITKETAEADRDANSQVFAMCNSLQTVCEQSAAVVGSPQRVHQFVIKVHPIATFVALKTPPRQPKTR